MGIIYNHNLRKTWAYIIPKNTEIMGLNTNHKKGKIWTYVSTKKNENVGNILFHV